MNRNSIGTVLALSMLALGAYAADNTGQRHHSMNSSINIDDNGRAEDLETLNGSIRIGNFAEVKTAQTVNGSVNLGDDGRASELKTVNGHVTIGARGVVSGDATTVNGQVRVGDSATVRGTANSVNGELRVAPRAQVGYLTTVNGNITVQDNARVERGILVGKPKGSSNWPDQPPTVTIGPGAVVNGELVFERPVKLRVHTTATIGTVKGAEVERFQ